MNFTDQYYWENHQKCKKIKKCSWTNHWGFPTQTSEMGFEKLYFDDLRLILSVFTISNRNQALKHEESVLRPNGHRFWEVILWWFLAIFDRFYHIKSKSGTKTRNSWNFPGFWYKSPMISPGTFFDFRLDFIDFSHKLPMIYATKKHTFFRIARFLAEITNDFWRQKK